MSADVVAEGWRRWSTAAYLVLSGVLLTMPITWYLIGAPHDWTIFSRVADRLASGRLYELGDGYYWVWSPIAAWLMAGVFVPLGYSFWLGLHLAAVALLREWRLVALAVLSVPFWIDSIIANTTTFVVVAGVLALRGSQSASLIYLALSVLMPRPFQIPLLVMILWRMPLTRLPFAAMIVVTVVASLASGYAWDWISVLVALSGTNYTNPANLGPTRFIGSAWFVVGIPLAIWFALKGRPGLAGLAMSPYLLPQYLFALLWELVPGRAAESRKAA